MVDEDLINKQKVTAAMNSFKKISRLDMVRKSKIWGKLTSLMNSCWEEKMCSKGSEELSDCKIDYKGDLTDCNNSRYLNGS